MEVQMLLLEAMPLVWCAVLVLAVLRFVFCQKCAAAVIIASAASLASAAAGTPPWLQVISWCGICLIVCIVFAWCKRERRLESRYALVISRTDGGRDGTVLYHGGYHSASPGCSLAHMPPCGSVVQVFICDSGHCIICPQ